MKVVGISGWKGSGKDSLAAYLVKNHGAIRVSFADPLKDMAAEEYGIERQDLDIQSRKELPILDLPVDPQDGFSKMIAEFMLREFRTEDCKIATSFSYGPSLSNFQGLIDGNLATLYWTPRALAILKGSVNRSVASNFWVQKALDMIAKSETDVVVVPDLRYKSEMNQLVEAFGSDFVSVRIDRFESSPSKDPSEHDLDDAEFNFRIDNRGSLDSSIAQLCSILQSL